MKSLFQSHEWCIIEEGFDSRLNKLAESIFSIGNGYMGQRANFEEAYSGESLSGSYIAGVYYTDKTRVGWWKNGYPEVAAKVPNAANWIGIDVKIGDETLDLHHCTVTGFRRVLNMKEGYLERSFTATLKSGKMVTVKSIRFCSLPDDKAAAIRYTITPLNFDGSILLTPYINGDVVNQDANDEQRFWEQTAKANEENSAYISLQTRKTGFEVCTGMHCQATLNRKVLPVNTDAAEKEKYISRRIPVNARAGDEIILYKYVVNLTAAGVSGGQLMAMARNELERVSAKGFDRMLQEQAHAWEQKWKESDIVINGDVEAQQGIRFNIFQLHQTYNGRYAHLNIGPKGFTGEKYGGATHWDTEAYCIPFYLCTAAPEVARNLLLYRYQQLDKAIANAGKLGFTNGAALYPMVTMNGEECHNEWEITFEEIHRNAAVAFAIYSYVRYTNDESYLVHYGIEVLIGIARFWSQRVNLSTARNQFVMLGVTGPNEYENNVNNNWYTNTMAVWCLQYAIEVIEKVKQYDPGAYRTLVKKINFAEAKEIAAWQDIIDNMYFPEEAELGIFLQQDGYMDKEQLVVKELPKEELPLNQHWSWDRILRSCFIKQADVLQGIYFLEEQYDFDTIRRNFDFYEPRTVHESSLSPCIHAILAAKLGREEQAYRFYLRTSRLDLDNYNNDTEDGLHITSMAGSWMSIVQGFAGMRIRDNALHFSPFLPAGWESFSFNILFRGCVLNVCVMTEGVQLKNTGNTSVTLYVKETSYCLGPNETKTILSIKTALS